MPLDNAGNYFLAIVKLLFRIIQITYPEKKPKNSFDRNLLQLCSTIVAETLTLSIKR